MSIRGRMRYSIDTCPICGGGLCTIYFCEGTDSVPPHGLIVCDECEAIWLQPDVSSPHCFPDAESADCPVCRQPLYEHAHPANQNDVDDLGWTNAINTELTMESEI